MPGIKSYKDLQVWRKSVRFAVEIYRITQSFPRSEFYGGLVDQIRRAAVSIPSNIAEGHTRHFSKVFANHLDMALGSAAELQTQLLIAKEVGFLSQQDYERLFADLTELSKMLHSMYAAINRKTHAAP
jgi:four helix bundle protein